MIDTGRGPTMAAALAMLALAIWIIFLGPRRRLHRAFALFLLVQGLFYATRSVDDATGGMWLRISTYFAVATPFVALSFAVVFMERFGKASWWTSRLVSRSIRTALMVAATVFLALHAYMPALYGSSRDPGPFLLFTPLILTVYAFIALVAARGYLNARDVSTRSSLFVLSTAFALEPMFRGVFHLLTAAIDSDLSQPIFAVNFALHALTLLLVLATTALFAFDAFHPQDATAAAGERRFLLATGAAGATGLITYWLVGVAPPAVWIRTLLALDAFWHIVLVALAAYAVLRYQLFDIDIRVRFVVKQSTFAAMVGLIFVIASESIERVVNVADTTIAVGVAVGIALLFRWLQQLSGVVARKVLPNVLDTPEDIVVRKEEIYRATVEGILIDGVVTPKERAILTTLARKLHLDIEDAARIERELLLSSAQMGAPGAVAQNPGRA